jgi:hypothetical protein
MEPGDKMGFPPGVAESMVSALWGSRLFSYTLLQVYQFFKKYQDQHFKRFPYKPDLEERWKKYREDQEKLAAEAKNNPPATSD